MKTGDRHSEAAAGGTRSDENVVRFPRDWVGPLDELLPIGPLPRSAASPPGAGGVLPPSADAFWSEDSAALHDAVTSRDGAPAQPSATPVDPAPPAPLRRPAARNARTRPVSGLIPRARPLGGLIPRARSLSGLIPRARVVAGLGLLAAVTLLAMAVIGYVESGGPHRTNRADARSSAAAGRRSATQAALRPATRPPERSTRAGRVRRHLRRGRVRARGRARRHGGHVHHAVTAPMATSTQATASTPSGTGTGAAGNPQSGTVTGSGPTTVDSHPVFTPPPASPAFGQQGTLGPGSSSDS